MPADPIDFIMEYMMEHGRFFITSIIPYLAIILLVDGLLYRAYLWARSPKTTATFAVYSPSKGLSHDLLRILARVFLFPVLLRQEKSLWVGSWLFHISLLMTVISHYKIFFAHMWFWSSLSISPESLALISVVFDGATGVIMVGALVFLFGRRFLQIMRKLSEPEDYVTLLLILAIALSGVYIRFVSRVSLLELRRYFVSLLKFTPSYLPADPAFLIHYGLVMILMIYFPIGKLIHTFGGGPSARVTPTHAPHKMHMNPLELATVLEQKYTRPSFYHLDLCARCGACTKSCHMFVETQDPVHSPAYKLALLRRVHRRYFTVEGRIAPRVFKTIDLNEESLKEISRAMFECTGCRRCTVYCPCGVDPPWPVSDGRYLFLQSGAAPAMLTTLARDAVEKAKNIGRYKDQYLGKIKDLESRLQKEMGDPDSRIPMQNQDASLLYIPMADIDSIMPAAKIFNAAGENWSLSELEATNYNYFLGDVEAAKEVTVEIVKEAEALGVKTVVIAESGHGFHIMKHLAPKWFNRTFPFDVKSIAEIMAKYVQDRAVKLDSQRNPGTVTYNDPCHLGRGGGIYEEPRIILAEVVKEFRELVPNRKYNWCCGGGGGLASIQEYKDLRMQTGKRKVEQIKKTGANVVTTLCENCRLQITDLSEYYNLELHVASLTDLMANAIIRPAGPRR